MFELYGMGKDGMVYRSPPPRRKEVDILEVDDTPGLSDRGSSFCCRRARLRRSCELLVLVRGCLFFFFLLTFRRYFLRHDL